MFGFFASGVGLELTSLSLRFAGLVVFFFGMTFSLCYRVALIRKEPRLVADKSEETLRRRQMLIGRKHHAY
jgi:hypothetical protein